MNSSSATMLLKLLQTSIRHEKKKQVKEQYKDGFRNFVVQMRVLKMKVGDGHTFFRLKI